MNQKELVELLKERFGKAKTAPRGAVRIPCPTCDAAKAKEMKRYVYPDSYYSRCYICEEVLKRDDLVGKEITYDRREQTEDVPHPQSTELPVSSIVPINQLPVDHPAVKFLTKDHLTDLDLLASQYNVGFIPLDGGEAIRFESGFSINSAESIIFPVSFDKKIVGWQIRFIPGTWHGDRMIAKKIKYLHVFPKGNYLYNFDRAIEFKDVVVVEGIKKAFKAPNAVATLGKGISEKQMQLMLKWKKVTLLLDGDEKTQSLAETLQLQIKASGPECRNVDLRKYNFPSPDEMTSEQVKHVVEEAWK